MWESQEVTLTCLLNFACFAHQIKLLWSLQGSLQLSSVLSTSLTTQAIFTQSKLTFQPLWTHHGKNLTCQVWNDTADSLLSQETVWLDVKRESPQCSYGRMRDLFSPPNPSVSTQGSRASTEGSIISLWPPELGVVQLS